MFSDFPLSPSFFFFFAELRFSFYFSPCCIEAASRWDAAPTHLFVQNWGTWPSREADMALRTYSSRTYPCSRLDELRL